MSDLVYTESLVKPLALGAAGLRAAHETYLDAPDVVALKRPVCVRATAIRARRRCRAADAIHLAAATEAACDAFVTSGRRLSGFADIEVALIAPGAE